MQTFLDTHAWIWRVNGDGRLSKGRKRLIESDASRQGVWISVISIWEVARRVEKRPIVLDRPYCQWLDAALSQAGLYVAELTTDILLESCELPQPFHGDPADQMIVATVRHHRGRLVTKDVALCRYPHLMSVW